MRDRQEGQRNDGIEQHEEQQPRRHDHQRHRSASGALRRRDGTGPSASATRYLERFRRRPRDTMQRVRERRLPVQPVGRGPHHPQSRRHLRTVHGALVRIETGDRHRTHRRPVRGARQRSLPSRRRDPQAVLRRPPEPDARSAEREPQPEARPRRRRLAAADEPLLVRSTRHRREAGLRPDRVRPGQACDHDVGRDSQRRLRHNDRISETTFARALASRSM